MSAEGKGKGRYCGAWAVARERYHCKEYFKSNIRSSDPGVGKKAKETLAKKELLEQLIRASFENHSLDLVQQNTRVNPSSTKWNGAHKKHCNVTSHIEHDPNQGACNVLASYNWSTGFIHCNNLALHQKAKIGQKLPGDIQEIVDFHSLVFSSRQKGSKELVNTGNMVDSCLV
ncbi:hypothetical protein ACROYT_G006939 [Oculina patagonica]